MTVYYTVTCKTGCASFHSSELAIHIKPYKKISWDIWENNIQASKHFHFFHTKDSLLKRPLSIRIFLISLTEQHVILSQSYCIKDTLQTSISQLRPCHHPWTSAIIQATCLQPHTRLPTQTCPHTARSLKVWAPCCDSRVVSTLLLYAYIAIITLLQQSVGPLRKKRLCWQISTLRQKGWELVCVCPGHRAWPW